MLFYDTTDLETDECVLNMQERRDGEEEEEEGEMKEEVE